MQVSDSVKEAERALAELTEKREAGERRQEELQRGLSRAHEALLGQNEALHQAREALTAVLNRLRSGEEALERLSGEEESLRARLRLIEATMTQSDGGLSEAEKLLSQAREALDARKAAHAAATESARKLEDELSAHKARIMERLSRMQNVRTSQARQSAMQQQMSTRRAEITAQLAEEEQKEQELSAALEQAGANLKGEQDRLTGLREGLETFEQSTKQLLADILAKQK